MAVREILKMGDKRLLRHAQRRGQAQDVALDQEVPVRVDERSPRHLKQLLVRHDQHLLDALQRLLHRSNQPLIQFLEKRFFVGYFF